MNLVNYYAIFRHDWGDVIKNNINIFLYFSRVIYKFVRKLYIIYSINIYYYITMKKKMIN